MKITSVTTIGGVPATMGDLGAISAKADLLTVKALLAPVAIAIAQTAYASCVQQAIVFLWPWWDVR